MQIHETMELYHCEYCGMPLLAAEGINRIEHGAEVLFCGPACLMAYREDEDILTRWI